MQLANYAELRAHFSARHLEDLANSNKIKCTQAKVEKLEGKIRELVSKLPAKRHTPPQTEEDIGKERAKLDKLQAELCKLGLQANEGGSKMGTDDKMGSDDDSKMGGGDKMRGNDEEDPDILDSNWSLRE